ncbi:MAG: CAP domain-containing protein [Nocardioidaceae bacterium]
MLGRQTTSRTALSALTVAILASVAWAAPATTAAPSAAVGAAAAYRSAPDRYENRVVYWTNVKRRRHGLPALRKRDCPDHFAESWVRHLARTGSFYHQDVTRMFSCPRVNVAGENLARGNVTPRQVVNAWMRSSEHRANILKRRYTHIGVGSVYSLVDGGRLYTSQTFTGR